MASTPKTSPLPNAGACTQRVLFEQVTKGVVLGDEIALLRVLIRRFAEQIQASQGVALMESAQAEADTNRISVVPHTSVCGQLLAVISEAMLRLASLLRTDHMLGGTHSKSALRANHRFFQHA